jgi:hypothetical protein
MNAHSLRGAAALLLGVALAQSALAATIFQSATVGPTGQLVGGFSLDASFFGARFTIGQTTNVTDVGGVFASQFDGKQVFAAIVPLSSTTAFPTGNPMINTWSPVATTVFTVNQASADVSVPLSVTLQPGSYGLIFGQGILGATNGGLLDANMTSTNPLVNGYNNFFRWSVDNGDWFNVFPQSLPANPNESLRFFVNGNAVSTPEHVSTGWLAAAALGGMLWVRRRTAA